MSQFPVDVDAEAIFVDGTWYTREDLSRRIRAMLDAGDFNVARPSAALQELTQMMQGVRTLAFRAPPELADALTDLATRQQQSVGAVIREAVTRYLTDADSGVDAEAARENTVRAPIPLDTTASSENLPSVVVEPSAAGPQVIAGPGALKAAGVGEPIELQRKQPATEAERAEQGWFKQ